MANPLDSCPDCHGAGGYTDYSGEYIFCMRCDLRPHPKHSWGFGRCFDCNTDHAIMPGACPAREKERMAKVLLDNFMGFELRHEDRSDGTWLATLYTHDGKRSVEVSQFSSLNGDEYFDPPKINWASYGASTPLQADEFGTLLIAAYHYCQLHKNKRRTK